MTKTDQQEAAELRDTVHPESQTSDKQPSTGMQKRVLAGGGIGQFIEFYDFTLYGLSAVTLAKLFFPGGSSLAGLLATFATFGVAFFVRPLGGLFFGALATASAAVRSCSSPCC